MKHHEDRKADRSGTPIRNLDSLPINIRVVSIEQVAPRIRCILGEWITWKVICSMWLSIDMRTGLILQVTKRRRWSSEALTSSEFLHKSSWHFMHQLVRTFSLETDWRCSLSSHSASMAKNAPKKCCSFQLSWKIYLWISLLMGHCYYHLITCPPPLLLFSLQGHTTTPDQGSASPETWPCVLLPADSSTAPCATAEPSMRQTSGSIWRASSTKLKCLS